MNNFGINQAVRDILRDAGILEQGAQILVASPVKLPSGRFRYLWNLHVHGGRRTIDPKGYYLLVGLAVRPGDTVTPSNIRHIFRVPSGTYKTIKTVAYAEGGGLKALDAYRVQYPFEVCQFLMGLQSQSARLLSAYSSESEPATVQT